METSDLNHGYQFYRAHCAITLIAANTLLTSKARIDPFLNVIESVFNGVGILVGKSLASFTGPDTMRGTIDDDILLVGTRRHFIVNLVVAQKIMSTHSQDQNRHGNLLEVTRCGVIVGAVIDIIHRMLRTNRSRTYKRLYGQEFRTFLKRLGTLSVSRIRDTDTLDDLGHDRTVVFQ